MSNLKPIIEESMIQYSGAVLQNRALVDVRDGLKPSARQILYCMYENKYLSNKPPQPTTGPIGDAMKSYYIHGDASCLGIIMRAAQPFAMRYPLVNVKGNAGTLISSGNYAAARYTKSRLSPLGEYIFQGIEKETIQEWREGIDESKHYPAITPSKGFYGICNGSTGIGIGMASSIPQFNLCEMNKALEHLLLNPNCDFNDIYIAPDFATGAVLLNEDEVKASMKKGTGFACKLRSVVDYDKKENCFVVTEIPYGVYTNTICGELEDIINGEENPGVDRFNDLTGKTPLIKIYLAKKANPNKVLKYLFKNTSLQSHYSINFTMLDNGRFPKVFTWKEMLQAHIDHEKEVYRRGYEFDLKKIEDRLHIIEGLLKVIEDIDNVVRLIKTSESTSVARQRLMSEYALDEVQTKAILDMKLSRLAHLEVEKLKSEKSKLEKEREFIYNIINNESEFNAQLIKGWRDVANKFGDARHTQILNISKDDEEPTETQELLINLSNQNNIYVTTTSTLYSQRRGGVGNKFKMSKGEYVIATASGTNIDTVLLFSNLGNCFHLMPSELQFEEVIPIESIVELSAGERIEELVFLNKKKQKEHIIFFTKKGILKKSRLSEYNIKRKGGVKALNLDNNDEIVSILFVDNEQVGMMTARGQFVLCETKDIRPIGRVARGVKGITLNDGDVLVSAKVIPSDTKEFLSVSEKGYIKRTTAKDFTITGRATKGSKIHSLKDNDDKLIAFAPINNERETIVVASNAQIKINLNEINLLSKGAQGTKSMKLSNAKIIGLLVM
jgi:DNA gyrase subunit A